MEKPRAAIRFIRSRLSELNWIHTTGMRPIGAKLAGIEKANAGIVDWAILFHDVAKDSVEFHKHAKEGAKICRSYLLDIDMHWVTIDAIVRCIETHGWAWIDGDPRPETIEAKIVFDADMIQQLGSMGIVKHVLKYRDEKFSDLLNKAKADLEKAAQSVLTEAGKEMAKSKLIKVLDFFNKAEQGE